MDTSALTAAETWSAEIVTAIEQCSAFLVLLSEHSVASTNVTKEVALASESQKTIVPIEISNCSLNPAMKYALAGLQKVSLLDDEGLSRAFARLGTADTIARGAASTIPLPAPLTTGPIRIAVLPFEDQSQAQDNQWFSDGLTDELISTLNKLSALLVLDRNSTRMYRATELTISQIARDLDVRYVIAGAVRKVNDRIRVRASLMDGFSGVVRWDDTFNGTMEDIFDIQEKTAREIVDGLKIILTPQEEHLLEEKLTESAEAYQLYLQAREKGNVENDHVAAAELCKQALAIDPTFLPALNILSVTYANWYRHARGAEGKDDREVLALQKQTIKQLLALDPNSYYCYSPRANYYLNIGEHELAIEMAKKAVELQPKKWASYAVLGFVAYWFDDYATAIGAFERMFELDPNNLSNIQSLLFSCDAVGNEQKLQAHWRRGRVLFERMLEKNPANHYLRSEYMNCAEVAGEHELAMQQARLLYDSTELQPYFLYCIAGVFSRNGHTIEAAALLRTAIDNGWSLFARLDIDWFKAIDGTPEYQFLLDHIFTGY
jgi:TolB-like protein/tetratricopeptide (TPR) repeat protein